MKIDVAEVTICDACASELVPKSRYAVPVQWICVQSRRKPEKAGKNLHIARLFYHPQKLAKNLHIEGLFYHPHYQNLCVLHHFNLSPPHDN